MLGLVQRGQVREIKGRAEFNIHSPDHSIETWNFQEGFSGFPNAENLFFQVEILFCGNLKMHLHVYCKPIVYLLHINKHEIMIIIKIRNFILLYLLWALIYSYLALLWLNELLGPSG